MINNTAFNNNEKLEQRYIRTQTSTRTIQEVFTPDG